MMLQAAATALQAASQLSPAHAPVTSEQERPVSRRVLQVVMCPSLKSQYQASAHSAPVCVLWARCCRVCVWSLMALCFRTSGRSAAEDNILLHSLLPLTTTAMLLLPRLLPRSTLQFQSIRQTNFYS